MTNFDQWLSENYPGSSSMDSSTVPKRVIVEYLDSIKDEKMPKLRSLWQTFNLESIIYSYLRDFSMKDPQEKIEDFEFYIDPFKKKVIVKFWVEKGK